VQKSQEGSLKLQNKTNEELVQMQNAIQSNPDNKAEGLFLYTPEARKKLDAIARQITYNLSVKRAEEGNPVISDGYSGRQSNRRR
jgi:hypothetical protein